MTTLALYLAQIGQRPLLDAGEEIALAQRVEAGLAAKRRLAEAPPSLAERRAALARCEADGKASANALAEANLRLVVHLAVPFARRHALDVTEMIQEGNLGLMRAVEGWDWRQGARFSTYASWWIRQSLQRAAALHRPVRLPLRLHAVLRQVRAAAGRFEAAHGRRATPEELAEVAEIDLVMVRRVLEADIQVASLDEPAAADPVGEGDDEVERRDALDHVRRLSDELLDSRSRRILCRRYGLDGTEPATIAELARELGTTAELVRRTEQLAVSRLRAALVDAA